MSTTRRAHAAAVLAVAVLAAAVACGGGRSRERPQPSLASSAGAAVDLGLIRDAWREPDKHGKGELRLRIERFLSKYGDDPTTAVARVYLVLLVLDEEGPA